MKHMTTGGATKFGVQGDASFAAKLRTAAETLKPVSVLFLDLDNFKSVNDDYDHATGDSVIREALALVQHSIEGKGELFHRSGDEMLVLLENFSANEAEGVAERIRQSIENHRFSVIGAGRITTTIGIATHPDNCPNVNDLEIAADRAAMRIKKFFKNIISHYDAELCRPSDQPQSNLSLSMADEPIYHLHRALADMGLQHTRTLIEEGIEGFREKDYNYLRQIMPVASVTHRMRVFNESADVMDVLRVECKYSGGLPWQCRQSTLEDNAAVMFPFRLRPSQEMVCEVRAEVDIRPEFNNAQFAARLATIGQGARAHLHMGVTVEAKHPSGRLSRFELILDVPTAPLKELYINLWRDRKLDELVGLAQAR